MGYDRTVAHTSKGKHQELPGVACLGPAPWGTGRGFGGTDESSASWEGEKARTAESQEFRWSASFSSYWSTPILQCTSLFLHYSNEKKKELKKVYFFN